MNVVSSTNIECLARSTTISAPPELPRPSLRPLWKAPPLGVVPREMWAQVVRRSRFGEPKDAMALETVPVPQIGKRDVLVYVMAAGVNYNNVWAGRGLPVDVIDLHQRDGDPSDFHIGGSDASGIVYAVGKEVTEVQVGDEVVLHPGCWDEDDPFVIGGGDDMVRATSARAWGYERNWGSFAQFCKVQAHQCLPKPRHLSWEASACYMLVAGTAYRMLHGFRENAVRPGDVVLVWGGARGVGAMAIQIATRAGAVVVAVASSEEAGRYCIELGAKGYIDRRRFDGWGMLPHWTEFAAFEAWVQQARRFGRAIWDIVGDKRNPRIVIEHPGESTLPISNYVCDRGGMVVACGGTSGYNATLDLRGHWMKQKRFQGSHGASPEQFAAVNDLVRAGKIDPALRGVYPFEEIPAVHQMMIENRHPMGNTAVRVGCTPRPSGDFP